MTGFGERLYTLRTNRKLSQEELAIAICTTKSTISKYEHSQIEPTLGVALKIADFFGVSIDYLAGKKHDTEDGVEYNDVVEVARENNISAEKLLEAINLILKLKN